MFVEREGPAQNAVAPRGQMKEPLEDWSWAETDARSKESGRGKRLTLARCLIAFGSIVRLSTSAGRVVGRGE